MKKQLYLFLFILGLGACKKDFLEKLPLDTPTDETFWTSESNVRLYTWDFYPLYFKGYASGFDLSWGGYFSGQSLNDDFAPSNPTTFTTVVPPNDGGWDFENVRKANLMINRVQQVPMDEEAINHWTGIGRFFRGLEYANLVKAFGDVPWYDGLLDENSSELYKPRDARTVVMDHVLEDFRFAAEHVRLEDANTGQQGLVVNKDVVLAYMSRVFLFEGTFLKYHNIDQAKATAYLEAAKWAANELILSGRYSVNTDYRGLFSSVSLAGNPEVILYRQYDRAQITHSLMSYVNREAQTGVSKDLIESYLMNDGLPITESPNYRGDKTIQNVMADRDPRINETFATQIRLNGDPALQYANYSTSGYVVHKFLNESLKDANEGLSNLNITDAPVIRYGEVLMNYAEAAAELGTLTQADLDLSINVLRDRPGVNLPQLQLVGSSAAVNGRVYDDPKRDAEIPGILWEIRRERRVELALEGFRLNDLKRWKKLEYTDNFNRPDINRGAWIRRADYASLSNVIIENEAEEGYIVPAARQAYRAFNNDRVYLDPIPLDQIKLYADQGFELKQNPGW
ncbi:RagB/SusD family nutrient uptake outer membrane protein [Olivibacter sp. XZL3]|uniref:RagB/SusD family nutrient uptake outer membrane protein n=1 Tax=Olivibacter sp. XZL3 TaxID=1735116 RepID=UPI001066B466|nr:RagB/SusD family nutrient uptake outer membrane protein [Olivibacter sp. XZL3]